MSVDIKAIELPGDAGKFIKSWWPIYKDIPEWVPPLIFDLKNFMHPKKNPYFETAEVQCFMAYRDGRVVGTIAATLDHTLQKTEPGMGMFGFFEFQNDPEAAEGLFQAACDWLRGKGMTSIRGPYNFSPNHEFALLIDGFDTPPMISNPHNPPYYQQIYEETLGLKGVMDWYAYWLEPGPLPPIIGKISKRFMDRNPNVEIRKMRMEDWDNEIALIKEIYNDAWEDNWGHTHMTDDELDFMAKNLKQIINTDLCYIATVDGEPAALSITLLDYNQVAIKMNGRIFPFGWYHFLAGRGKIDCLRIFILGVKKKFQKMPIGAPLYVETWNTGLKMKVRGAEASLILDTNHRMRGALEKLGGKIYKTYRTYESSLNTNR